MEKETDSSSVEKAKVDKDTNILTCDQILDEIGGLGPYQILVATATGIALLLSSFSILNFIFASNIPDHRCWIPECEFSDTTIFQANWTKFAIPMKNGALDSCSRYAYIPSARDGSCSEENFDRSQIMACDGYITKNREERLISHLNLFCTGHEKSMPLIGTASTTGKAAGIIFTGIVSDKLGRLHTFVGCLLLSSIIGCLQALPVPFMSFELYAVFEFLAAFVTSGVLGSTCAFNMEWAPGTRRTFLNTMALFMDSLHPAFIGLGAWYFEDNFVGYKLIFAATGFVMVLIYLILNEPPPWLLMRQKYSRLIRSIRNAGRINGSPPSAKLIERIRSLKPVHSDGGVESEPCESHGPQESIRKLFTHKKLVVRLFVLSFAWLSKSYAYYGITLGSIKVHDNPYISYVSVGLAAIPGALLSVFIIDRLGRRKTISVALLGFGALMLITTQLSNDLRTIKLILFFVSRATLKVSTIAFFMYAMELWPTAVRSRVFNICSLAGRIGGVLATLSMMLVEYNPQLPLLLNGCATIVSAVLFITCLPETMHSTKPPDTFEEALNIGAKGKFKPKTTL